MNEIVFLYWDIAALWAVMVALGALVIGMSAIGMLMVAAELRYQLQEGQGRCAFWICTVARD